MSRTTRVLIVDDFQPFRAWVSSIVESRPDLQTIADAADGLEAVRKTEDLCPDLIILDVGLPELNGVETAQRILKVVPDANIIFLSQETSAEVVRAAIESGASGYVAKTYAGAELLKAIQAVLQGKVYLSDGLPAEIYTERFLPDCEPR